MATRKVAVVLGGGQGTSIGHAISCAFAQAGYDIAVVGRSKSKLNATVAELQALGTDALACKVAGGDAASISAAAERICEHFGRIDALVVGEMAASAGTRVADLTQAALSTAFETGFAAPLRWMRACHDALAEHEGIVVQVASAAPPRPGLAALLSAQAALRAAGDVAATEWEADGIRVAACETCVATPAVKKLAEEHPEAYDAVRRQLPNGEFEELDAFAQRVVETCA